MMTEELKPCPFCGGVAESDSMQTFRRMSDGALSNQFSIYCTMCDGHMGMCYEDYPDLSGEAVAECVRAAWNTRTAPPPEPKANKLSNAITLTYTNWRGETAQRRVTPIGAPYLGTTKWHPEPCWLLPVWDHDKEAKRDYELASCDFTAPPLEPEVDEDVREWAARALADLWGQHWKCVCSERRGLDCDCGDAMNDDRADRYDDSITRSDCYAAADVVLRAIPRPAGQSDGADAIAVERRRQMEVEGWTPEHDDEHTQGQLSEAAISYVVVSGVGLDDIDALNFPPIGWPWDTAWWKPSVDCRRNLVKAGALIAAEIDRLDRAALRPAGQGEG